jgi:hypothetical protein
MKVYLILKLEFRICFGFRYSYFGFALMGMEIHHCEVCGVALDPHFFEFCYRCRRCLCFDISGQERACAKTHPNHIGYYYCQACLDHLFLCRGCGQYRTRRGRFPLKDHICEECQKKL